MDIGAIESELILIKQPSLFVVVDNMLFAFLERRMFNFWLFAEGETSQEGEEIRRASVF